MRHQKLRSRRAFTLIEVLIVVVILGIVASVIIPQFSATPYAAKESALRADLVQLRSQIQLYRFQHDGVFPNGTADNVVKQLTWASTLDGNTAAAGTAGYPYGPYLIGQLPTNPFNGGNGVLVKSSAISSTDVDPTAMQGSVKVGWIYSSYTGQVIANSTGNAGSGIALSAL